MSQLYDPGIDPGSQMVLNKPLLSRVSDLYGVSPSFCNGVGLFDVQETHELKLKADMILTMSVAVGGLQSERQVETGYVGEARRSAQETPRIAIGGFVQRTARDRAKKADVLELEYFATYTKKERVRTLTRLSHADRPMAPTIQEDVPPSLQLLYDDAGRISKSQGQRLERGATEQSRGYLRCRAVPGVRHRDLPPKHRIIKLRSRILDSRMWIRDRLPG